MAEASGDGRVVAARAVRAVDDWDAVGDWYCDCWGVEGLPAT